MIYVWVYAKVAEIPPGEVLSYKKSDFDFLAKLRRKISG